MSPELNRALVLDERDLPDNEAVDPTEPIRRALVEQVNAEPGSRAALETKYTQVWDTDEMEESFTVTGFLAPLVVVKRKSDGVKGSLMFQHRPRFYFRFQPH